VAFQELAVAVTQGTGTIGQIFGSGKVTFNATPGTHAISLLARPAATAQYATWGYDVSTTPPAPTVTFSAASTSVGSGGTTTLTWSSTGATSCAATGGWSGTKAISGSETTAALTAATSFTLACTGAGGTTSSSVSVGITTAESGGGGGRLDATLLCLALGLLMSRAMAASRRRLPRVG
jgi:hypothetical protein